jgi:hypothetical protein
MNGENLPGMNGTDLSDISAFKTLVKSPFLCFLRLDNFLPTARSATALMSGA